MCACLQWLKAKEGNSASERAKMPLSKETIDGLRMTGRYKYIYIYDLFFVYPLHSYKYVCIHV